MPLLTGGPIALGLLSLCLEFGPASFGKTCCFRMTLLLARAAWRARAEISTHTKILLGLVQTMGAFSNFSYVKWPSMFQGLLKHIDMPLDLQLIPVDCMAGYVLSFYERFLVILLIPLAASLGLLVLAVAP